MRATAADPVGVYIEGECGGGVIEPRLAGFRVGAIGQPERGGGMAEVLNAPSVAVRVPVDGALPIRPVQASAAGRREEQLIGFGRAPKVRRSRQVPSAMGRSGSIHR